MASNIFDAITGAVKTEAQKASNYVNGWASTSTRLRSIAGLVLILVFVFVIGSTFFSNKKFFPHQPSRHALQKSAIFNDIKAFEKLHFPKNVNVN